MEYNHPLIKSKDIISDSSTFFNIYYIEKGEICMKNSTNKKAEEDIEYIYRPWITRNGVRIYASSYGKKAFKTPVKSE